MPLARQHRGVELVATIPVVDGVDLAGEFGLRTTLGVLTEIIATADQHVVLGSPFLQGSRLQLDPLGNAITAALRRGVCVDVISTSSSLASLRPGAARERTDGGSLRTFQPAPNVEDERALGSHAKFCAADGAIAYIGSANLTLKGVGGHLEMGTLVHGLLARRFWRLINRLFEVGYFVEIDQKP